MASRGQPVALYYIAFNLATQQYQTADAGNHTIYLNRDGTTQALATNGPVEISAAQSPGQYYVLTTSGESTCNDILLSGVSTTPSVILFASPFSFEQLPTAAPGASGGVQTVGTGVVLASNGMDAVVIEAGLNARQSLSIIAAAAAGASSGVSTGSPVYQGAGVATVRISATAANGNRSAVTLTPPT